jgi:hypothetical protein
MDSSENLERRVAAVEAEVALARQEAAADRDVADYGAEMRAHTRGLTALRETQLDHHAEHKADLAQVKADLTEVKTVVTAGMGHIVRLLEDLGGGSGSRES